MLVLYNALSNLQEPWLGIVKNISGFHAVENNLFECGVFRKGQHS